MKRQESKNYSSSIQSHESKTAQNIQNCRTEIQASSLECFQTSFAD